MTTNYLYDEEGLIAHLEIVGVEMRELWGHFKPKPAFERHRPLFEEYETVLRAYEEAIDDKDRERQRALDEELAGLERRIDALGLKIGGPDPESAEPAIEFRVEDGMFFYKFE